MPTAGSPFLMVSYPRAVRVVVNSSVLSSPISEVSDDSATTPVKMVEPSYLSRISEPS